MDFKILKPDQVICELSDLETYEYLKKLLKESSEEDILRKIPGIDEIKREERHLTDIIWDICDEIGEKHGVWIDYRGNSNILEVAYVEGIGGSKYWNSTSIETGGIKWVK